MGMWPAGKCGCSVGEDRVLFQRRRPLLLAKQERAARRGWCCGRLSKGGGSFSLARGGKAGEQGKERLWLAAEGEEAKGYGCERDGLVREKIGSSCSGGG